MLPCLRQPVLLAASPHTTEAFHADVIAECREWVSIRRHREVGKVAFDHGPEPLTLLIDRRMPVPSQHFLDLAELGLHSLRSGLDCLNRDPGSISGTSASVKLPREVA